MDLFIIVIALPELEYMNEFRFGELWSFKEIAIKVENWVWTQDKVVYHIVFCILLLSRLKAYLVFIMSLPQSLFLLKKVRGMILVLRHMSL